MTRYGKNLFVTGIDTGIGKTVVSAIFAEALQAHYWKPIQCGDLDLSDTNQVCSLVSYAGFQAYPEAYRFALAQSPHRAAAAEHKTIDLARMQLPSSQCPLVVEGVGGALVPLNDKDWAIDMAVKWQLPTVVVTKNYLGSLNHTFLTVEALRHRGVPIRGLVFNGKSDQQLEEFIMQKLDLPILLRIAHEKALNQAVIASYAQTLRKELVHG